MKKVMKNAVGDLVYAFVALPLPAVSRRHLATRLGIGHARRGRLAALAALPLALLVVYLVAAGWLYPLRPDTISAVGHPFTADPVLDGAWGGPTLVGAWLVHALVALGMQVGCIALIGRLNGRRTPVAV